MPPRNPTLQNRSRLNNGTWQQSLRISGGRCPFGELAVRLVNSLQAHCEMGVDSTSMSWRVVQVSVEIVAPYELLGVLYPLVSTLGKLYSRAVDIHANGSIEAALGKRPTLALCAWL